MPNKPLSLVVGTSMSKFRALSGAKSCESAASIMAQDGTLITPIQYTEAHR